MIQKKKKFFFLSVEKKKNAADIIYVRLSGIISFFFFSHTKIKWTICDVCEEKHRGR